MGPSNAAPLSFPMKGYTFAIDFPVRDGLEAATFRRMYARLDEWLAVKRTCDPANVFTSDLGRRLGLCG